MSLIGNFIKWKVSFKDKSGEIGFCWEDLVLGINLKVLLGKMRLLYYKITQNRLQNVM
jgi:hypothetical protein